METMEWGTVIGHKGRERAGQTLMRGSLRGVTETPSSALVLHTCKRAWRGAVAPLTEAGVCRMSEC